MIIFGKQKKPDDEGLRALTEKINKFEAERKSLYSIIDKLSDCLDETNRRFDVLVGQVESFENRLTDIELKYDNQQNKILNMEKNYIRKGDINAYERQDDVAGVSE